jgi:hypothetical protein
MAVDVSEVGSVKTVDLRHLLALRTMASRRGRWLTAAGLLAVLLSAFWAAGIFAPGVQQAEAGSAGAAVFFSVIIAYIVPIFAWISERTVAALDDLRGWLGADDTQFEHWRERVYRKPLAWLAVVLGIGLTSGITHNLLLYESVARLRSLAGESSPAVGVAAGTMLVWLVMTLVFAALIDNATLLGRLARRCRIDLLQTHALRPFARVAVLSTLAIIGAAAVFPIMFLDDDLDAAAYVPGLLGTGISMLLLAGLPIWPLHRRIADAKAACLHDLNARMAALPPPDVDHPQTLSDLAPLLAYRREIFQVSEWPFDVGAVARLGFYLIIPPLTWVGAALIENVVEAFL